MTRLDWYGTEPVKATSGRRADRIQARLGWELGILTLWQMRQQFDPDFMQ